MISNSSDAARIPSSGQLQRQALDRSSPTPLYRQVERILRRELASEEGDGRLTESDLIERFGVSRFTVRQALARLVADGLIDRRQRRGTYPASKTPIEQPLGGLYSFVGSMHELGLATSSTVLSIRAVRPDDTLQRQLAVSPVEKVVELIRLRFVEDEPLTLESIWVPDAKVPGMETADLTGSIYEFLQKKYGIHVSAARESIRPVVLDGHQATLLHTKKGTAAFFVERISFQGTVPVEVRHHLIRGDRYLFSVQLRPFTRAERGKGQRKVTNLGPSAN